MKKPDPTVVITYAGSYMQLKLVTTEGDIRIEYQSIDAVKGIFLPYSYKTTKVEHFDNSYLAWIKAGAVVGWFPSE